MNFIEKIMQLFFNLGELLGNIFSGLIDFLSRPLAFLLALLEGIFYFIGRIFTVVSLVVSIFIKLFQFFFSLIGSLLHTVMGFANYNPDPAYSLPNASRQGFEATLEAIGGTGLLTVIPLTLTALLWLLFMYKITQLLGGRE